jgi:hypothetical protein
MQLRLLTAIVLFLGSYLPLSVILLAQNLELQRLRNGFCWPLSSATCDLPLRNSAWSIGSVALTFTCFLLTVLVLFLVRPRKKLEVRESKYIPSDLMNYTLPYIVSFMSVDYQDAGKFIGFAVFLGWMFWISYKSGQILMNPLLIALSWRLYEVKVVYPGGTTEHLTRALVKGHLAPGEFHHAQVQDLVLIKRGC